MVMKTYGVADEKAGGRAGSWKYEQQEAHMAPTILGLSLHAGGILVIYVYIRSVHQ